MSKSGAATVTSVDVEAHLAVRAWRALGSEIMPPNRVEKVRQSERSTIFRLFGARPGTEQRIKRGVTVARQ